MEIPGGEVCPCHFETSATDDGRIGEYDLLEGPFPAKPGMLKDGKSILKGGRGVVAFSLRTCRCHAAEA